MSSLQREITEQFIKSLADSKDVTPEMIVALTALLSSEKKAKADDFVAVFASPRGGAVR